jgi:hypothetical protein
MSDDFCIGCGCDRIHKELEEERDKYKAALESIYTARATVSQLKNIAKEALNEVK